MKDLEVEHTLNDLRRQLDGVLWCTTAHDLSWPFIALTNTTFMRSDLLKDERCQISAWP